MPHAGSQRAAADRRKHLRDSMKLSRRCFFVIREHKEQKKTEETGYGNAEGKGYA